MHDTYGFLRELADSWALLALFAFFLGTWIFAWRPGSRPLHEEAAGVPFRHEVRPLADPTPAPSVVAPVTAPATGARTGSAALRHSPAAGSDGTEGCGRACPDCACSPTVGGLTPVGGRPLSPEA